MELKKLQLYIHIPFCKSKCAYCDFLSFPSTLTEQEAYVEAMLLEIESYRIMAKRYIVSTIFIGGGTPSILEPERMVSIMERVKSVFRICENAEITIEMNPGTVTADKVKTYKEIGMNRVSIGLQATEDEELRLLGRIHTYHEFLHTYELVRQAGIHNINIDLISAIPKQTVRSWEDTLNRIIAMKPTHISAYSLIIEEGTLFYEKFKDYESLLPDEEEERQMYHLTNRLLQQAGYHRYEISNYAKNGYECKHNIGYWDRVNYLGIGLGSASLLENVRRKNESNMESYLTRCHAKNKVYEQEEYLTREAQMEEFMFLGLRKITGVSKHAFHKQFHVQMEEVYGTQLCELTKKKLLCVNEDRIMLTEKGIDVSNYVMAEFLID